MVDAVKQRLASFGYTATDDDLWVLEFIIQKVGNHILSHCNLTAVPDGLYQVAVDMAAGEFFQGKAASGQLNESTILGSESVKEIKTGDTTVVFAASGSGPSFQELLGFLLRGYQADLEAYRCMQW